VPGELFWSVTVYDTATRSQVQRDQDAAALRSMFELKHIGGTTPVNGLVDIPLFAGLRQERHACGRDRHFVHHVPAAPARVHRIVSPRPAQQVRAIAVLVWPEPAVEPAAPV
jgi:hypothetical protein